MIFLGKMILYSVILILLIFNVSGQGGLRGGLRGENEVTSSSGNRRRQKPKRQYDGKDPNLGENAFKALTITYPLHFFNQGDNFDWRRSASYSSDLIKRKDWVDYSQAQDQEDVWVYENWFYGMEKGIVMESGALNGLLFSNSFLFENFANWTCIHVEADPENYQNLKFNRQKAINVHGALCSEPRLLHYSSLGVVPVRGFVEFMTPSFLKKWHGKIYNNKTRIEDLPTVQCLQVKLLLRQLNVKHIDLWILDTEGAEESVLLGTDFNEIHFNAVAMECDEHDETKNKRKMNILENNGFECRMVERNCMCKHKDFVASAAPVKSALRKWDGNKWSKVYVKDK